MINHVTDWHSIFSLLSGVLLILFWIAYMIWRTYRAKKMKSKYFAVCIILTVLFIIDNILGLMWEFTNIFMCVKGSGMEPLSLFYELAGNASLIITIFANFKGGVMNQFKPSIPPEKCRLYKLRYFKAANIVIILHVLFYICHVEFIIIRVKVIYGE